MGERDWQKDWQMCEKATPAPWLYAGQRRFDPARWSKGGFTLHCVTVEHPNGRWEAVFTKTAEDAHFIAQAREALPYWLQRVKELEERLRQLEGRKCETCRWWKTVEGYDFEWNECDRPERYACFKPCGQGAPFRIISPCRDDELQTRCDFGCVCWEERE